MNYEQEQAIEVAQSRMSKGERLDYLEKMIVATMAEWGGWISTTELYAILSEFSKSSVRRRLDRFLDLKIVRQTWFLNAGYWCTRWALRRRLLAD